MLSRENSTGPIVSATTDLTYDGQRTEIGGGGGGVNRLINGFNPHGVK